MPSGWGGFRQSFRNVLSILAHLGPKEAPNLTTFGGKVYIDLTLSVFKELRGTPSRGRGQPSGGGVLW